MLFTNLSDEVMKAVHRGALVAVFQGWEQKHFLPERLCKDVPYSSRYLRNTNERIARLLMKVLVIASSFSLISVPSFGGVLPRTSEQIKPSLQVGFERINVQHGLSHAGVNCILKDRQGFMWFGTAKGLNRYDGYSFKVFQEDPRNPEGLSGNLIYTLREDKSGHIWIGSVGGGLNKFDPIHETFTHYKHNPANPNSLSSNEVYAFHKDLSGRLWIGTRNGLDQLDEVKQQFVHIDPDIDDATHPITNQVTAIYERTGEPGVLWIGTWGGGLKRFDCERKTITRYRHDPKNPQSLSHNSIRFIYEAPAFPNILWIGTEGGGLNRFDIASERFTCFKSNPTNPATLSHDVARSMLQDQSGILWVGTSGGGLNRFDPVTGIFIYYKNDPRNTRSLSNDYVTTLLEDETGVHWIGTREGVNRFSPTKEKFVLYQHDPNNPKSLSNNFLYSLYEDKAGVLWIATGKGMNKFDPVTETFTAFVHNPEDPTSLQNNFVRTIYEDRSGTLWVGNTHGVLHRFDRRTGRARAFTLINDPKNEKVNDILSMLEDRDGTFWIGTTEGLNVFDRKKETHTPMFLGSLGQDRSVLHRILVLYEDNRGTLWIGTRSEGLLEYQRQTGKVVTYKNDVTDDQSLSHNTVTFICEDRAGVLWVATAGGGLNRFDGEQKGFTAFTIEHGLPDNVIYGILEDNSGNLWLSTDRGLCKFNPVTRVCTNFETRHGLQGSEFNSPSCCKSKTGAMYFGGVNGLNAFHPDSITDNEHVPPVFVTAFKSFGRDIRTDTALSYLNGITIPSHDNFLSFEFAALDFKDQVQNKYAYMLDGLDEEWVQSGTRRYAAYTDLHPGEYVFRVKGSNNNGVWNENGASVHITITPSYWQTWWFKFLTGCALVGFFAFVYRREVGRLRKDKMMQQEFSRQLIESQEAERKRVAGELHDGLGQELMVIMNRSQVALKARTIERVKEQLDEITQTTSRAIEDVREMAFTLSPYHLEQLGLTDSIRTMVEKMARLSSIQFTITIDPIDSRFSKNVEINVYRLVQESVTNIVKHSKASHADVIIKNRDHHVEIIAHDDGVGFDVSTGGVHEGKRRGFGLAGLCERVTLLNGALSITSSPGKGTSVGITIPYGNSAKTPSSNKSL